LRTFTVNPLGSSNSRTCAARHSANVNRFATWLCFNPFIFPLFFDI
jgi:hypothetical protein